MKRLFSPGDLIQFGILVVMGLGMMGGFWNWADGHFAKQSDLDIEKEDRRELKAEVDQLYIKLIPQREQAELRHRSNFDSGLTGHSDDQ